MKTRKSNIVIIGVFLTFIYGIAAGNVLSKDRTFSEMESRILAGMPDITIESVVSGKFMTEFETYVTDQFVARDRFIQVKSAGERIIGKKINNGVYYGKDGYLAGQVLSLNREQLNKNVNAVKNYSKVTEAEVTFALIPGSVEINREKMPSSIPDVNQKEVIEEIYGELAEDDVNCVDVYSALWDNRDKELYYRTDHHWTSLGAYYGYRALCNATSVNAVPIEDYNKTVRSSEFYGTLFSKTGAFWLQPDSIVTYVEEEGIEVERFDGNMTVKSELYVDDMLEKKDKYSMFLGGNQPLAVIRSGKTDLPKLLVVRDSYFDSMAPFMAEHYSEIHVVDFRYNRGNIEEYMKENEIGEVLIIYSLANFHEDKNVGYVLGSVCK